MSALTTDERLGLDEVFLSIHSHEDKYIKIKELSSLIMSHRKNINFFKVQKQLYNS